MSSFLFLSFLCAFSAFPLVQATDAAPSSNTGMYILLLLLIQLLFLYQCISIIYNNEKSFFFSRFFVHFPFKEKVEDGEGGCIFSLILDALISKVLC